jgi:hypothetical protein
VVISQIGSGPPGAWRVLILTSPELPHKGRHHASIYFGFGGHPTGETTGLVHNVDQLNFDFIGISAFLDKADFAAWLDVLRNERPLKFEYRYDGEGSHNPDRPTRELFGVQLYTGLPEPPGEGLEDLQAKLFPTDALDLLRKAQGSGRGAEVPKSGLEAEGP